MTVQQRCNMEETTPFSKWLRNEQELDSKKGYVATDIDFIWRNHKKDDRFMILEEKRYGKDIEYSQTTTLLKIHHGLMNDEDYCGTWIISFENTNPDDGEIRIKFLGDKPYDFNVITKEQFIQFMQFNFKDSMKK